MDSLESIVPESGVDTQEEPRAGKRQKPMPGEGASPKMHASSVASDDDDDDSDSDDSDVDIPLASLFGKKSNEAPVVLNDSSEERAAVAGGRTPTDARIVSSKPDRTLCSSIGAASDPIVLDSSQESCGGNGEDEDDNLATTAFPPTALSDDACFICGSDLKNLSTGLKGRLNHLKRCSKKHGVTARDVKLNDDSELFVSDAKPAATESDLGNNKEWHAGAATDLALANHGGANKRHKENVINQKLPASKSATKQTTMGNFFQMPVRSLNNVLLAGARRMAKSTELLTAKKSAGGNNASNGGKRKRVDYSKVRCYC